MQNNYTALASPSGNASDVAIASRLNAGEKFAARVIKEGQKIEYPAPGIIRVSDISNGHEMNTKTLRSKEAINWVNSQRIS